MLKNGQHNKNRLIKKHFEELSLETKKKDGVDHQNEVQSKAGWIFRDHHGRFCGASQARGKQVINALEAELQAIVMALQHTWSKGYRKIILERDCKKAIDIINGKVLHFGFYNWKREVMNWMKKFEDVKFTWISREGNRVADTLAKQNIDNHQSFIFHYYVPRMINNPLHYDHVTSLPS